MLELLQHLLPVQQEGLDLVLLTVGNGCVGLEVSPDPVQHITTASLVWQASSSSDKLTILLEDLATDHELVQGEEWFAHP